MDFNFLFLGNQYLINNFQVVGNSLKSLEVSEEKANQRVEEFKREMKVLTVKLKEAENRAENAEKSVKRLQKEVDRLEGIIYVVLAEREFGKIYLNAYMFTSFYYKIIFALDINKYVHIIKLNIDYESRSVK